MSEFTALAKRHRLKSNVDSGQNVLFHRLKRQELSLVGLALLIIVLSVLTTLWVKGALFALEGDADAYQNITFTDAVLVCETETRELYKKRLRHLVLDGLSSRYDKSTNLYRIFFISQVAVRQKTEPATNEFLISCLVSAKNGSIEKFEAFEKKEPATSPGQRDRGGVFGWPN